MSAATAAATVPATTPARSRTPSGNSADLDAHTTGGTDNGTGGDLAGGARVRAVLHAAGYDPRLPLLRLLGPLDVVIPAASTRTPRPDVAPLRGRGLALLAFLAAHPGADRARLAADFWRAPVALTTLHPRIAELRRWLGHHPDTAAPLLPLATDATGYRLHHDLRTDVDLLHALAAAGTEHRDRALLRAALRLVRDAPFARLGALSERLYRWRDPLEAEVREAITDTALSLASLAADDGDHRQARHAAALGLHLEPGSEALRRAHVLALWHLREIDALHRSVAALRAVNAELGCQPEPATCDLLAALRLR